MLILINSILYHKRENKKYLINSSQSMNSRRQILHIHHSDRRRCQKSQVKKLLLLLTQISRFEIIKLTYYKANAGNECVPIKTRNSKYKTHSFALIDFSAIFSLNFNLPIKNNGNTSHFASFAREQ